MLEAASSSQAEEVSPNHGAETGWMNGDLVIGYRLGELVGIDCNSSISLLGTIVINDHYSPWFNHFWEWVMMGIGESWL